MAGQQVTKTGRPMNRAKNPRNSSSLDMIYYYVRDAVFWDFLITAA